MEKKQIQEMIDLAIRQMPSETFRQSVSLAARMVFLQSMQHPVEYADRL